MGRVGVEIAVQTPQFLFHGTSRHIEGEYLTPAMPGGDVGDPDYAVVFATDKLDFATLFAAKNEAVSHISSGLSPYILVSDPGKYFSRVSTGSVIVLSGQGFTPAIVEGESTGKWWSASPVPIPPDRAIAIDGHEHLRQMGVLVVQLGKDRERRVASHIAAKLKGSTSRSDFRARLENLVESGDAICEELTRWTPTALAALLEEMVKTPQDSSAFNTGLDRYFDSVVAARLDLRIRTRLVHGADHACRTAILCRILHNLLATFGVMERLSNRDLLGLMVAGFLHDSARRLDSGPDDSSLESARHTCNEMLELGFSRAEAETGQERAGHDATGETRATEAGAAIVQTADALELIRNYKGDIHLPHTPVYRLLKAGPPAAMESFLRIAEGQSQWLRSLKVWGWGAGHLRGPEGIVLATSTGPDFNPMGVFRRNLSVTPFSTLRSTLRSVPLLDRCYAQGTPGT